ncbi:protein ASYMMETRIC LEAVES 2 [Amaranthus tricolor]|uniref:protein ASYMMETRIC LEAVES 2 n=1 Tax=Amaranthus tricolor TaxID=29722 RepID=UPI00258619BC|nr:protein ASYMMETRIC LEAVES 2 [Amaranthus tricolor]XP_057539876.1 protein ASYMMETRIC LEAVES 2 [Amaranthus tricolor]
MASSSNSPCAACKFLRRKCQPECVFAPYFPPDQPQKFANVHKVFGASNVTKLLNELHPHQREDAVNSLAYEADMRLRDPVYGCVGVISLLQHQLRQLQMDLSCARSELSKYQNFAFPSGGGVLSVSAVASSVASAATNNTHHQIPSQSLGINLLGLSGGGGLGAGPRDQHQLYSHHQFFPSNHQTSGLINSLRGFDMAVAGGGGNHGYDAGGLLAMNMNVSAASGIGQLGQLHQQPTARTAGGDDRRSIDPS